MEKVIRKFALFLAALICLLAFLVGVWIFTVFQNIDNPECKLIVDNPDPSKVIVGLENAGFNEKSDPIVEDAYPNAVTKIETDN